MNRQQRRAAAKRVIKIKLTMRDVPQVADVLCIVEPRGGGAVTVLANTFGQACLEKVFPRWRIPWAPNHSAFPRDWLHAVFDMPDLVHGTHNLPPITDGAQLEQATPPQFAFWLAMGAYHQGARAMMWNDGGDEPLQLFIPPRGNN
jgi:hypothetical protein